MPWPAGFPDVVVHTTVAVRDAHPAYGAAKSGDAEAALRLASDLLNREAIERLRPMVAGQRQSCCR